MLARRALLLAAPALLVKPARAQIPNGVMVGRPGGTAFGAVFTDSASGNTSFPAMSLGVASATRIIIVVVNDAAGSPPTGCTIAGNACTLITSNSHSKIFALAVPTGATATVALIGSSSPTLNAVALYAMYGKSSVTPTFIGNNPSSTTSATCQVNGGGIVIVGAALIGSTGKTLSGTGIVQDSSEVVTGDQFLSGSLILSPTSHTQTVNCSGTVNNWSLASWGP